MTVPILTDEEREDQRREDRLLGMAIVDSILNAVDVPGIRINTDSFQDRLFGYGYRIEKVDSQEGSI